ncbi:hypothetical protein KBC59_01170 [Patescibacteria group bacterium]|jgi:hypothetical protein|nr:hypothetical protein [Patescibacteria group bacterium]
MWFRLTGISLLKWMALLVVSALLLRYVFSGLSGWWLALPMWAVAFGISFLFADWAFSVRTLSAKEMGIFIGIWMGITITLQLLYAQFLIGDVRYALNSIELYVQYLLELLAIFLASSHAQKKRMRSVLGEGMGG